MIINYSSKILITGSSGFLGKSVTKILRDKGYNNLITFSSKEFDLKSEPQVKKLFKKYDSIDCVIHIAADIGGIGYSSKFPAQQFYNNTLINTYMIHYSNIYKIKKFIGIGSVCEYPEITPLPFKEEDLWNGYPVDTNDAYGLSKRMMLAQSIAYKKQFNMNIIHLLMINLYGPGDNFDLETSHVIPALIRKFVEAKERKNSNVEIWGSGKVSREFLFVEDAAKAIILSMNSYNKINPLNIGTGNEVTIRELVELISSIVGYTGSIKYNSNKPEGQKRRVLDISKAKKEIGFLAKTGLKSGIEKTYKYFINKK